MKPWEAAILPSKLGLTKVQRTFPLAIQDFDLATKKVRNPKHRQIILAVDNDADMEVMLSTLREKKLPVIGYTKDAKSALELVRKHKMGVLFIDGDFKGFDLPAMMKKMKINYPEIRVVIISGSPTRELVEAANENGALGFVTKPLKKEAIIKVAVKI